MITIDNVTQLQIIDNEKQFTEKRSVMSACNFDYRLKRSGPLYQNFLLFNCNIWKKFGLVCLLAVMMMVSYFFLKGTCGPMA